MTNILLDIDVSGPQASLMNLRGVSEEIGGFSGLAQELFEVQLLCLNKPSGKLVRSA